jgi:hypothetical protein
MITPVSNLRSPRFRSGISVSSIATITATWLTIAGCGRGDTSRLPVHPVLGTIQFRGQPIGGAFVSLHREDSFFPKAPSPRATVDPDGKFALSTYDAHDGAPEGEYVLTVQWYKPLRQNGELVTGPNVLPAKYAVARTSDVRVKITAGGNQLLPIQLR